MLRLAWNAEGTKTCVLLDGAVTMVAVCAKGRDAPTRRDASSASRSAATGRLPGWPPRMVRMDSSLLLVLNLFLRERVAPLQNRFFLFFYVYNE